jgi:hypothetical protein
MKRKASIPMNRMPMKPTPMPTGAQALQQRLNVAMRTPAAERGSKMTKR